MITFLLLTIIAIIVTIIAAIALITGGVAFIVVFGDLIVCVAIIILLMRWLFKKNDKRG